MHGPLRTTKRGSQSSTSVSSSGGGSPGRAVHLCKGWRTGGKNLLLLGAQKIAVRAEKKVT